MSLAPTAIRAASVFSSKGSRPAQEDHVLSLRDKGIFVIADGFGGPVPGAEASQAACEAVRRFLVKEAGDEDATMPFVLKSYYSLAANVLFNALIHANRKVRALNKGKNVHEKGGASVLAGFMDGDLLALANVGGCSAWLLRDGRAAELVTPRTYGRLLDPFAGAATRGGELDAPLTSVGMSEDLEPEIFECRIRPRDWLLFQTDGIDPETRERIVELQRRGLAPGAAAEEVISLLNRASFDDNASLSLKIF